MTAASLKIRGVVDQLRIFNQTSKHHTWYSSETDLHECPEHMFRTQWHTMSTTRTKMSEITDKR